MKKFNLILIGFGGLLLFLEACQKLVPAGPKENEVLNGPVLGLSYEQKQVFNKGAEEFDEIYRAETGLGPIFVATSCVGCHAGDNKGHPFTTLTRFGQTDTNGNLFVAQGGPQLQHLAIPGYEGEKIPTGATSSRFIAPIVAGLGFLELVSDQDILALADPQDRDGDGISGRPHWNHIPSWVVPNQHSINSNGKFICRFGRKASVYNLQQQVVGAFNNDMGITTSFMPQDPINFASSVNPSAIGDADIDDKSLNATVFYIQALQVPLARNQSQPNVMEGKEIFKQIDCNKCHIETLKTQTTTFKALSNVEFHPYTDLLLHDMGYELNDQYTEGFALASEWRTTPLWGVGLSRNAQGGQLYLMHDGRAQSFDAAIQLHGGEANGSRNKYNQLSDADKQKLVNFLESL